jgi:hypothetical protein
MDGFKKLPKYKAGGIVKVARTGDKKAAAPAAAVKRPAFKGSDVEKEKSKPAGHKDPYIKSKESTKTADFPSAAVKGRNKKDAGTVKKYANGGGVLDSIKSAATDIKNNIIGSPEQNKVAQANLDKQATAGSKLAQFLGGKAQAPSAPAKKRGGKVC